MTLREFYLQRRQAEFPAFMKVLQALPSDQLAYKPHERSPSAEQIVWTLASELQNCLEVVRENRTERKRLPVPHVEQMLEMFEKRSAELVELVAQMDDAAWNRTAQFYFEGKMISEQRVSDFLWYIHFDAIHHRGQLTTYLRPMGGTVPSVYGPSGDEPVKQQ